LPVSIEIFLKDSWKKGKVPRIGKKKGDFSKTRPPSKKMIRKK
jgi:hypothetical protein